MKKEKPKVEIPVEGVLEKEVGEENLAPPPAELEVVEVKVGGEIVEAPEPEVEKTLDSSWEKHLGESLASVYVDELAPIPPAVDSERETKRG